MKVHVENISKDLLDILRIDCSNCSGLCCVALFFSKMDGFPQNKEAGKACINLNKDFKCRIHSDLEKQKMKGCIGYDCFGAGQQVTKTIYSGETWLSDHKKSQKIFDVFIIIFQLHQMLWYLGEARTIIFAKNLWKDIDKLINENIKICNSQEDDILKYNIEEYRDKVNNILKKVSNAVKSNFNGNKDNNRAYLGKKFKNKNFNGVDLSMSLLIAADFENCSFHGTNFLGADTRDTNFSNCDLREAIFLTQGQINSALGNSKTLLPYNLTIPSTWKQE
ncbi:MAG: hypothetical protein GX275_08325 [Clostridiales bacterium]|nr:hypothetical protein [Clostridiales bacterium]